MPNDPWKGIPDEIKAFRDGWEDITDHGRPYEVVLESDFSDDYWAARMCGTYEHIARSITAALVVRGKDVTSANILEFLLGDCAIAMLEDYTSQMLFKRQHPPLLPYEFKEFRGSAAALTLTTKWRSTIACHNCTRGFAQIGRTGCDEQEQWMEQGSLLKHMHDIEVAIFQRSVETLVNHRNGCIVVDDELIASRATDVEQKVVSNRKRGKEGPVADCAACSLTSICFGMRLRSRSETNNVSMPSAYISNLVLFSNTIASESRKMVEEKLLVAVDPLTIGQRCADWFLMKSMLLSGTMAGKIVGAMTGRDTTWNAQPSDQTLTNTLQECMQSWFGRHKSTAMMALGSRNENPTMRNLSATLSCVKALFEVGLLRWRRNPCIGVSPDGVCILEVVGRDEPVLCCLEIKTRTAASTIEAAEAARSRHGKIVITQSTLTTRDVHQQRTVHSRSWTKKWNQRISPLRRLTTQSGMRIKKRMPQ
ncbi:hypothetical protein IV203_018701 [Nitzschia inconspicua]|uniref:Uncharacterized protein n=2 Tax=Nitzschia inconspicua TaxID=303405 RepID=A0A9K3M2I2_9STRA|nr:hypothetical protein IV203_018701 [Nitzschia inconspicua]